MYKLSVPIVVDQLEKHGARSFIDAFKATNTDYVFIAGAGYNEDAMVRENKYNSLKKFVKIFKDEGFTVGLWHWTFEYNGERKKEFAHITNMTGKESGRICPSDEKFTAIIQEHMSNLAKCDPDIILFDDDFRYGALDWGGIGCSCKNHRAYMSKETGEDLSEADLSKLAFVGGKNKYRTAWLKANGHFFKNFALKMRSAVDEVNPNVRIGVCACFSGWDIDGFYSPDVARTLAGKTKPFMRLIGAPYWSHMRAWGNHLQDVIELSRMENSWVGGDIEVISEGDVFPRPRFICASNRLEGFDMALRASGDLNGIHKYMIEYGTDPIYDDGYIKKHIKNKDIYQQIDKHFSDKEVVGVRVYECPNRIENMDMGEYSPDAEAKLEMMFFSPAARMLSTQTIPTIYKGLGTIGVAFGENAKYLDEGALDNGLILDWKAASILQSQGVDVGIEEIREDICIENESVVETNYRVFMNNSWGKDISVKEGANIKSYFGSKGKDDVGSYFYENANGQKFLVFAFDGYRLSEHAIRQYTRGQLIAEAISWMGKKLPASMPGNPECYILVKENEQGKAVWIGNFFEDECLQTTITLDQDYSTIEFINCTGKLDKNKVILDYVAPFASVGFAVKNNKD